MTTIKEIGQRMAAAEGLDSPIFAEFADDSRVGVQKLLAKRRRELQAELEEEQRLDNMLRYERELYAVGYQFPAGVDEVGRGPLAGPVLAAAVILPQGCKIKGLNDSKKIPKKKHAEIYQAVMEQAVAVGIGLADSEMIDRVNIYQATKLAMKEAVEQLSLPPDCLLIDAMELEDLALPQRSIVKGDAQSLSIAAASIVAKVTRDRLMEDYDRAFPGYDFACNAGYGTQAHLAGLARQGLCPIHRKTFEPVKSMLK